MLSNFSYFRGCHHLVFFREFLLPQFPVVNPALVRLGHAVQVAEHHCALALYPQETYPLIAPKTSSFINAWYLFLG